MMLNGIKKFMSLVLVVHFMLLQDV